jgi:hypothetical protein
LSFKEEAPILGWGANHASSREYLTSCFVAPTIGHIRAFFVFASHMRRPSSK